MYVPALARAHLAAESVISANKVSLGLKGVAGGQWGRAKGDATLLQRPTLCSRNTYTRVHVRERVYGRAHVHTYELAAVASLEQGGGIIRSATINPNDDDAVMTLSRTSFQATSVTLRAHLPPFSRSLHSLARRLFVPLSFATHAYLCLYPDFYIYLYLSPSSSFVSVFRLSFSFSPLCPHVVLSNSPTSPLPSPPRASWSHHYSVLRGRKLSSFHDRLLPCTIRQQFVPTVKTRHCNSVLCGHSITATKS